MKLAWEITKIIHGPAAAKKRRKISSALSKRKKMPAEVPVWRAEKEKYNIVDLLAASGLAASKSEARRFVAQGAVKIKTGKEDFTVVQDIKQELIMKSEIIVSRGKLRFIKVTR